MVQVPISGAYTKVLYEFEDSYGVPIGGTTQEGARKITRILGHGIKVASWTRDNALKGVVGLNNTEPSAIVDGPFSGKISLEFEAIADISWMRSVMGREKVISTSTRQYVKDLSPPSMTFLIYMNNDSSDPNYGDAFILTGVVCSSIRMSIDASDSPLHVTMDCEYQTEYKLDNVSDIPTLNSPADEPFNYTMAAAYFWNPGEDINQPSSFDSMECIIDKVNFTIKHQATLQKGISYKFARDKWFANIEYDMSMSSIFKDPKKFLERFYGCYNTPSKYIAPYEQITIIFENFFRDQRHAQLKFAFQTVKIKSLSQPLAVENVIMEDLSLLPIHCDVYTVRGAPGTPYFNLSPKVVEKGKILYVSGENFFPGENVTLTASFLPNGSVTVPTTCLGELRYTYLIPTNTTSGVYNLTAYSETSIPAGAPSVFQVTIFADGERLAALNSDTNVFSLAPTQFTMSGSNFGSGDVNLYLEKFNESTKAWDATGAWSATVPASSVYDGMFNFASGSGNAITMPSTGKFRFKAASTNGVGIAYYTVYVPEITIAALSNGDELLTVRGQYFPPNQTANMSYENGATELHSAISIPVGLHSISSRGYLPGPSVADTITYARSVAFLADSNPYVSVTIQGVNSGYFTLTKTI